MKTWLISGIAAIVLLGLGGYLIKSYGTSQFDAGEASCKAEQAESIVETNRKNTKTFERIQNETKAMPISDVDAELNRLGIMRAPDDR